MRRTMLALFIMCASACGNAPSKGANSVENNAPDNVAPNNVTPNNLVSNNRPTEPYEITDVTQGCDGNGSLSGNQLLETLDAKPEAVELSWTEIDFVSTLTIRMTAPADPVFTCTPGWDPPPNSGAASSPASLSLAGIVATLTTTERLLDNDEFVGTATLDEFAGDGLAVIRADIAVDDLVGGWRPVDAEPTLHIEALQSATAITSGVLAVSDDPVGSVTSYRTVATWPAR